MEFKKKLTYKSYILIELLISLTTAFIFYFIYRDINIMYFYYVLINQCFRITLPHVMLDVYFFVKRQKVASFFIRPLDFYDYLFSYNLGKNFIQLLIFSLILFLAIKNFNLVSFFYFFFFSYTFKFLFYSLLSLTIFYILEGYTLKWIFNKINMLLSLVPVDLFPDIAKKILMFFPNYYFTYFSVNSILNGTSLTQLLIALFYLSLLYFIFVVFKNYTYKRLMICGL